MSPFHFLLPCLYPRTVPPPLHLWTLNFLIPPLTPSVSPPSEAPNGSPPSSLAPASTPHHSVGLIYSPWPRTSLAQPAPSYPPSPSSSESPPMSSPSPPSPPPFDPSPLPSDLPIALRKPPPSCPSPPLYPLAQFASSHRLSSPYHIFLSHFDFIPLPKTVEDALANSN